MIYLFVGQFDPLVWFESASTLQEACLSGLNWESCVQSQDQGSSRFFDTKNAFANGTSYQIRILLDFICWIC